MHAFWPLFFPFIVSSQWCLFGEITFALDWESLIKSFLKEIGTKRTLPPPGSSLPISSPSRRPLDIGTATKDNTEECSSSLLCVWMRESEGLFIGWEEEWRPLNMTCQRSVCLFASALGSNSNKMDGGDGVELCFLACLRTYRCTIVWKAYIRSLLLKSLYSSAKYLYDTIGLYTFYWIYI